MPDTIPVALAVDRLSDKRLLERVGRKLGLSQSKIAASVLRTQGAISWVMTGRSHLDPMVRSRLRYMLVRQAALELARQWQRDEVTNAAFICEGKMTLTDEAFADHLQECEKCLASALLESSRVTIP